MEGWDYSETEEFVRYCEKNNISQVVKDALEDWAIAVKREPTPRNKRVFTSPSNIFEIWAAGIGNPDANKGKSGGYRFIYYIHLIERKLFVDRIENRNNLDFKRSTGKYQKNWDERVKELRKELLDKWDKQKTS